MEKSKAAYHPKPHPDRPRGKPLDEAEKVKIRKCLAEGMSITDTARAVGVGASTVSRLKRVEGLTHQALNGHDNSKGAEAYQARARERSEQRAMLMHDEAVARLEYVLSVRTGRGKWKTMQKLAGGAELPVDLDWIPAREWRETMQGIATLDNQVIKHDERLSDSGQARAASLMEQFMTGLVDAVALVQVRDGLIQR